LCGGELRRRDVNADDPPRAAALQPGTNVRRSAPELDDISAPHVGQDVHG